MTRKEIPDICDFCGKDIKTGNQYCCEIISGKYLFADKLQKSARMDICHGCLMAAIKKSKWKPEWKMYKKNTNYQAGSKDPKHKYWLISGIEEFQENEKLD